MTLAIFLMVAFLVLLRVLELVGFSNNSARDKAAKKIAEELHLLLQRDDQLVESLKHYRRTAV